MVFNSDIFLFAFLPVVYTLFWTLQGKQGRYLLLAAAGYVFYGWWDWRFCFLLLFSSLVSFIAGQGIAHSVTAQQKRFWVLGAVGVDLFLLGFFKYYNFFAANIRAVHPDAPLPVLQVVLPIGISFYTFHTISYILDVAAGRVSATKNLLEYLTYVNLFSQLVAGPIVRFRQIEEDLERIDGPPKDEWTARGIGFFVAGMIKKVIIADRIAAFVDPILKNWTHLSFVDAWVAALGYTFQLYYDFSGYSDMAVGLGYLFALRIPQNFDAPYRALGITDFWRRWHISLSSWLRDYLYIGLGGNRKGVTRTYLNLMITMVLGGLWHGANWTFIIWGAYHGALLIADRVGSPLLSRLPRRLYQLQTFLLVVIGWVLFRSENLEMAGTWLAAMATPDGLSLPAKSHLLWLTLAGFGVCFLPETWDLRFGSTRKWAAAYAFGLFATYFFMNGSETVFLYYQF